MAWPPKIQQAEDRMEKAKADLQADIDSDQPYESKRSKELLKELNQANASFLSQVIKLAKKSSPK
jgi:hypothetical protein